MERIAVDSSAIHEVGYDKDSQTLELKMPGGIYRYAGVPEGLHKQFLESESKGKFFHANVKGKFAHVKHEEKQTA